MAYKVSNVESIRPIDVVTSTRLKDITMYNKIAEVAKKPNAMIMSNVISFAAQVPNDENGKILHYHVLQSGDDLYYTSSDICNDDMIDIMSDIGAEYVPVVSFKEIVSKKYPNHNPTIKCILISAHKTLEEAKEKVKELNESYQQKPID